MKFTWIFVLTLCHLLLVSYGADPFKSDESTVIRAKPTQYEYDINELMKYFLREKTTTTTESIDIPDEEEFSDIVEFGYYSLLMFTGVMLAVLVFMIFQKIIEIKIWCKLSKNPPKPQYRNLGDQMMKSLVNENEYLVLPNGKA
ncbi:uncharacterized protein [Chironomus tepperi]|uniref:uncharacterized protein n=1 Tax=Chironomus tepperi TaxID=113505 RepID=UPI00391F3914